ncbi:cupin domain-containing protein [Sphingomonas sp. MMS24-J13]|uniref:cupin domain-containing protein n=1 Tax=Sphingomonas sp. MMS24-J13 TaxID=3238686 RepID=UPI0038507D1B
MTDLGLPAAGSRATPPAGDWAPSPGSPGWSVRALLLAPGLSTQLMRVEPGTVSAPHAHDQTEQVYILDGSLYDDDGTIHPAGTFIVRAAGAVHGGGSRDGATMLVVYSDA